MANMDGCPLSPETAVTAGNTGPLTRTGSFLTLSKCDVLLVNGRLLKRYRRVGADAGL